MKSLILLTTFLSTSIFANGLTSPRVSLTLKEQTTVVTSKNSKRDNYIDLSLSTSDPEDVEAIREYMRDETPSHCLLKSMSDLSAHAEDEETKALVEDLMDTYGAKEVVFTLNYTINKSSSRSTIYSKDPIRDTYKTLSRTIDIHLIAEDDKLELIDSTNTLTTTYDSESCDNGLNENIGSQINTIMIDATTERIDLEINNGRIDGILEDFSQLNEESEIRKV